MKIEDRVLSKRFYKLPNNRQELPIKEEYCYICNESNFFEIAQRDRNGNAVSICICESCDLISNLLQIKNPNEYYRDKYYRQSYEYQKKRFLERIRSDSFSKKRFDFLKGLKELKNTNSVMEIGCADGCNLYWFNKNNSLTCGYDFDQMQLDIGNEMGLNLRTLDELKNDEAHYDLIMIVQTLHMVRDIEKLLNDAINRLNDNGVIYVEVPGIRNWISLEQKEESGFQSSKNIKGVFQFDHNYYFEAKTLEKLMEKFDLKCIYLDEWCRGIFKKTNLNNKHTIMSNNIFNSDIYEHLLEVETHYLKKHPLKSFINVCTNYIQDLRTSKIS